MEGGRRWGFLRPTSQRSLEHPEGFPSSSLRNASDIVLLEKSKKITQATFDFATLASNRGVFVSLENP
eukprot:2447866-Pyramimonas_sp.AAC.1